MNRQITIAPVRKSVLVQASPERAFEVFTARLDRWWPKTHGIGKAPVRESIIEPFVGGRWYTRCEDDTEVVVGHVHIWQPPERLVVSWEVSAEWKPDPRPTFCSEVEVRFVPEPLGRTSAEPVDSVIFSCSTWPLKLTSTCTTHAYQAASDGT